MTIIWNILISLGVTLFCESIIQKRYASCEDISKIEEKILLLEEKIE